MRQLLILFILFSIGCDRDRVEIMGESTQYFPAEVYNGPGAVWKYFVHVKSNDGERMTDIRYRKIVLEGTRMYQTDYTADFRETYKREIIMDENRWILDSFYGYNYRSSLDSLRSAQVRKIGEDRTWMDWQNESANLSTSISDKNWIYNVSKVQEGIQDTLVNNEAVKVLSGRTESTYIVDADTSLTMVNWQKEYTVNKGMTKYTQFNERSEEWQLDEIMSVAEFDKRASQRMRRVAYIDPADAIDDLKEFSTCYHISKINDYYNGDLAQYIGGKGGLWELLENHLDEKLLVGQEGYLTYRFVVNCEGKAGRFVTEEADLKYNRVEFSDELRNHFLEILLGVPKWKNLTVEEEARDAYVYVTFKIKGDEIVEILP